MGAAARRPSFQFYPADWEANTNLGRCSLAAQGAWVRIMCKLHDSDEYGVARFPLDELANAAHVSRALARELARKAVLKGADPGETMPAYTYTPRSGRREGPTVELLPEQPGPVWFSSRMVRDEHLRKTRGASTRFGTEGDDHAPDRSPKSAPSHRQGDGSSSSSSSSSSASRKRQQTSSVCRRPGDAAETAAVDNFELNGHALEPPPCPQAEIVALWRETLPQLPQPIAWRGQRVEHLRARWRELAAEKHWQTQEQGLAYFGKVFRFVGQSKFLLGQKTGRDGRSFIVELPWLIRPENFLKVIEGKYHEENS